MCKQINGLSSVGVIPQIQYNYDIHTNNPRHADKAQTQLYRIGTVAKTFYQQGSSILVITSWRYKTDAKLYIN